MSHHCTASAQPEGPPAKGRSDLDPARRACDVDRPRGSLSGQPRKAYLEVLRRVLGLDGVLRTAPTFRTPRPSRRRNNTRTSKRPSANDGSSSVESNDTAKQGGDYPVSDDVFAQIVDGENPGPGGPPNNWPRAMRDDLRLFVDPPKLPRKMPHGSFEFKPYCGPMQQRRRASSTGGSSEQPNGAWPGGTYKRRKRRVRSALAAWMRDAQSRKGRLSAGGRETAFSLLKKARRRRQTDTGGRHQADY